MTQLYIIRSIVTDLLAPKLSEHLSSGNPPFEICDVLSAEKLMENEPAAKFLLFTARLETLLAASAAVSQAESLSLLGEFAIRATSLFEKNRDRLQLLDLEDAAELHSESFSKMAVDQKWPGRVTELLDDTVLPDAIDRLIWMEKKSELEATLLVRFGKLEACTTPLHGAAPGQGIADGERALSARRLNLMGLLKGWRESATVELEEARSELERQRLSEEISDLLISQLQEELEATLVKEQSETASFGVTQSAATRSWGLSSQGTLAGGLGRLRTFLLSKLGGRLSLKLRRDARLIEKSGLFDPEWYLSNYPDVAESHMRPLLHYLLHGAAEGRDPSPRFSTEGYMWRNSGIDPVKTNPLVHSILNNQQAE